jgi:hypothetical protein
VFEIHARKEYSAKAKYKEALSHRFHRAESMSSHSSRGKMSNSSRSNSSHHPERVSLRQLEVTLSSLSSLFLYFVMTESRVFICHLQTFTFFFSSFLPSLFAFAFQHAMKKEISENQTRFKAALGNNINYGDYVEVREALSKSFLENFFNVFIFCSFCSKTKNRKRNPKLFFFFFCLTSSNVFSRLILAVERLTDLFSAFFSSLCSFKIFRLVNSSRSMLVKPLKETRIHCTSFLVMKMKMLGGE